MRRKLAVFAPLGVLVFVLGIGAALAQISSVTIDPIAKISSDGAHVTVSGTFVCDAGQPAHVTVLLDQGNLHNGTAIGGQQQEPACTGQTQSYAVATGPGSPHGGKAAIQVEVANTDCSTNPCSGSGDTLDAFATVKLQK